MAEEGIQYQASFRLSKAPVYTNKPKRSTMSGSNLVHLEMKNVLLNSTKQKEIYEFAITLALSECLAFENSKCFIVMKFDMQVPFLGY